eukprot:jgi/Botrbrau1/7640/Bobra.0159s0086.1
MVAARIVFLAAGMLLTGSLNTIATKFQDITVTGFTPSGEKVFFQHPAAQSAFMFLGEFLCLIPFLLSFWSNRRSGKPSELAGSFHAETPVHMMKTFLSFSLPAICDAGATTLLNIGLFYTYASTFQMLRGTLVVFAGFLTIIILKRQLHTHHWLGIVLITAGAALVGASSILYDPDMIPTPPPSSLPLLPNGSLQRKLLMLESTGGPKGGASGADAARNPALGDMLVVVAQLAAATQFIVEEKYLAKYRVPALLAVGLEGFWGLVICCIALPLLSVVKGPNGLPLDSAPQALREIMASPQLQLSTIGSVVSIAFFNFFGISVTKSLSGAARATIDAVRTLLVWMVSLLIGWEHFHALQVVGFVVLISGSSLYNELIRGCLPAPPPCRPSDQEEPLLGRRRPRTPPPPSYATSGPYPTGSAGRPPPRQPSHARAIAYTLARSMRLYPTALSPHSLASTAPPATPATASLATSYGGYVGVPSDASLPPTLQSPLQDSMDDLRDLQDDPANGTSHREDV